MKNLFLALTLALDFKQFLYSEEEFSPGSWTFRYPAHDLQPSQLYSGEFSSE